MINKGIRLFAAGMVWLILTCVGFAQSGTAFLEGSVKGEDGKPMQATQIRLDRTDGKGTFQVKTDKKGHWMQAGLPIGATFNINLVVDGKVALTKHNVRTTSDGGAINFDMAKDKKAAPSDSK